MPPPFAELGKDPRAAAAAAHHGMTTLEFTSHAPLQLARFQDLLAAGGAGQSGGGGGDDELGLRASYVALLSKVRRLKALVWFDECRTERWVVHLAGRQRLHIEHDGPWRGRPRVELVAIGSRWQPEATRLRRALEGMCVGPSLRADEAMEEAEDAAGRGEADDSRRGALDAGTCDPCALERPPASPVHEACDEAVEAARVREMLEADPKFEVIDVAEEDEEDEEELAALEAASLEPAAKRVRREGVPNRESMPTRSAAAAAAAMAAQCVPPASRLVHFQLVGAALYGMTREQLETAHGVDLNALNSSFLEQLNASVAHAMPGGRWTAKPCLTGAFVHTCSDGVGAHFTLRFAVGGRCRFEHVWQAIERKADEVLSRAFRHLQLCKCDMA